MFDPGMPVTNVRFVAGISTPQSTADGDVCLSSLPKPTIQSDLARPVAKQVDPDHPDQKTRYTPCSPNSHSRAPGAAKTVPRAARSAANRSEPDSTTCGNATTAPRAPVRSCPSFGGKERSRTPDHGARTSCPGVCGS